MVGPLAKLSKIMSQAFKDIEVARESLDGCGTGDVGGDDERNGAKLTDVNRDRLFRMASLLA